MRTYPLSMVRNYVSGWGLAEAVREIIQNAIDSDSPFTHQFERDQDGTWALSIQSAQTRLNPQSLLLGCTDKTNDPLQIGQFGEGFKLALLVLTRLGHLTIVRNGPLDWLPRFEHSELFGAEQLVVREVEGRPENNDLIFEIYGLTNEQVDEIVASCLFMQNPDPDDTRLITSRGIILLNRPKALYVGGLYVCETDMRFGYNVKPQYLKLERDRKTVSTYDMYMASLAMWYETGQWDVIAKMIDDEVPDVQYSRYDVREEVQEACYRLFNERNPGARVAGSQSELENLKSHGSVVRVNAGMYNAISTYSVYRTAYTVHVESPTERLQWLLDKWEAELDSDVVDDIKRLITESSRWSLE